jgi:hypothetical protein
MFETWYALPKQLNNAHGMCSYPKTPKVPQLPVPSIRSWPLKATALDSMSAKDPALSLGGQS